MAPSSSSATSASSTSATPSTATTSSLIASAAVVLAVVVASLAIGLFAGAIRWRIRGGRLVSAHWCCALRGCGHWRGSTARGVCWISHVPVWRYSKVQLEVVSGTRMPPLHMLLCKGLRLAALTFKPFYFFGVRVAGLETGCSRGGASWNSRYLGTYVLSMYLVAHIAGTTLVTKQCHFGIYSTYNLPISRFSHSPTYLK